MNVLCPSCHSVFTAVGDGLSDRGSCPKCHVSIFTDEGKAEYERYLMANPPLSAGEFAMIRCKCGACTRITGNGKALAAICDSCKEEMLIADGKRAHTDCMKKHYFYGPAASVYDLTHPTDREGMERMELARHGVEPPDGFKGYERWGYQEFEKKNPGVWRASPSEEVRDRWNAYQRSLPESVKKSFMNQFGVYSLDENYTSNHPGP